MVAISGIGSGTDFSGLIDAMVAAERIPITMIEQRKTSTGRQLAVLGDLMSKLKSLDTKAVGLDTKSEIRAVVATSSNDADVKVVASGVAAPARFSIVVDALASAQT